MLPILMGQCHVAANEEEEEAEEAEDVLGLGSSALRFTFGAQMRHGRTHGALVHICLSFMHTQVFREQFDAR